ncbi:hypothetical protein V5799_012969 [Amblyomma americanum]|uniref:Fucosyltransferase n=1 Tax=Amblyomma americanum TaxID=6943 RepID=A0AAQ4E7D1_AMBAM
MQVLTEVMDALQGSAIRGCGASDCGCYEHPLEAIYDAFRYDLIPVYFGQKTLVGLPEHSFVDAFAMLRATDIIDYLSALLKDWDLYCAFFKWKEEYVLSSRDDLCYLCDALKKNLQRKTTDVVAWWKKSNLCPLNHRISQAHSQPHEAYVH